METTATPKFFILQFIEDYLTGLGMGIPLANTITFIVACVILFLLGWLLDYLGSRFLTVIVHAAVKQTKTQWDDFLFKRHFFNRLVRVLTAILLLLFIRVIFKGYNAGLIDGFVMLIRIFMVFMIAFVISSVLDAGNDVFESKPISRQKSIKSLIQAIKIVVYIIAGILAIALLLRKDPSQLFLGLGASAAILTLVFKDTILGFVASIQISAQDMIRPGDWIEMPSKNADGVVTDINVNSVKVRNWNNTVTVIPIYTLVTDAFTNWRNMEESAGRRFKRPLLIDIKSIVRLTEEQIGQISQIPEIAPYAERMRVLAETDNTSPFVTNLGLYRSYIEAFLEKHPKVAQNQPLIVRYLPQDENGLSIELYAFSSEKNFKPYERIVSDIIENVMSQAPAFGLRFYQRTGAGETGPQTGFPLT